jgi:hypothetical protein
MIHTETSTDPWNQTGRIELRYEFDDAAGEINYYRLVPYEVRYMTWNTDTAIYRAGWELFTDENADGTHISKSFTFDYYDGGDSLIACDMYLMNCNYDYYSFHRSVENSGMENPFSEPTLVYTNVNGGLGIFAAANGEYRRNWR